jgi:MFS transporter, DHA1 family, inner membrane transport protein
MAFFHNRSVNLINLHSIVGSVAMGGGGAFFSAYLLKAGLSVPQVLLSLGAMFALRLVLRVSLLSIALRLGLRRTVIVGALLMAASFPFLIWVNGIGWGLFWLVLTSAIADTIYWPSFHAYYAALGDADHRGQQLGIQVAAASVFGIVSPLAAAWLLVVSGPSLTFTATAAVLALSALPLLWTPDVPIARKAPGAFRAALSGAMLFVGDGWIAAGYFMVWQIALFLTLGQSYLAYGGALAVAALVGAVGGLMLGRLIDSGKGTRAVWYSVSLLMLVIAMRAGVLRNPALAVAANAMGSLVGCLYVPTLMTAVYNQAKRSPCVLRFHIAAEGGWDIGVTTGLSLAALLTWLGFPIAYGILISLLGAASVFVLLHRYYADHSAETVDSSLVIGEFQAQASDAPKI